MNTLNRQEITHRATSLGLAALLTLSMLGSIQLLTSAPAPDSLLAHRAAPAQMAAAPAVKSTRS